jgi:hypothetical protein
VVRVTTHWTFSACHPFLNRKYLHVCYVSSAYEGKDGGGGGGEGEVKEDDERQQHILTLLRGRA